MMAAFATRLLAVAREIVHDLSAAGGVADVDGVVEMKMVHYGSKIVGVVIHVVAVAGLRGASVAAAVVRDDAVAVTEEEQHLVVPVVGGEGPAVAEDDGLTLAPILVVDL